MSGDFSLFGDDEPSEPAQPVRPETTIANWQIDLLRKALSSMGLTTMADRQGAIERAAERSVTSLRELTHDEAMMVLSRLATDGARREHSTSLWESREEDTWIDRL